MAVPVDLLMTSGPCAMVVDCIVRKNLAPWTMYAGFDCRKVKDRPSVTIKMMEQRLLAR